MITQERETSCHNRNTLHTDRCSWKDKHDGTHLIYQRPLTATEPVKDCTRICETLLNILNWCSRGAGTAEPSEMYLTNSTPTADAMCILNEWLESLRSLGNSSLRERDSDSCTTEKRRKQLRLKGRTSHHCYNSAEKCCCVTFCLNFLDLFHPTPFLLRINLLISYCKYLLPLHENKGITTHLHVIKHLQLVELASLASFSFLLTAIHSFSRIGP